MGIFGDDKRQDERIAALERHVRALTETVQANQADIAAAWIAVLGLQAQVFEKVSSSDVDPAIVELNKQLGVAREQLEKSAASASETWATLQGGRSAGEVLPTMSQTSDVEARYEDAEQQAEAKASDVTKYVGIRASHPREGEQRDAGEDRCEAAPYASPSEVSPPRHEGGE